MSTHAETRRFWQAQDWSKTNQELASLTGRPYRYVWYWRRRHAGPFRPPPAPKPPKPPKPPRTPVHLLPPWRDVDWTLQNSIIAGQIRRTRERVRQMRKTLGKPQAAKHGKLIVPYTTRPNPARESVLAVLAMCCDMPSKELAKKAGVSQGFAHQMRRELNLAQARTAMRPFADFDWRLADIDLARLWAIPTMPSQKGPSVRVSQGRRRLSKSRPLYLGTHPQRFEDADYTALYAAEKIKADAWLAV